MSNNWRIEWEVEDDGNVWWEIDGPSYMPGGYKSGIRGLRQLRDAIDQALDDIEDDRS